jgi:hypothetical protein
MGDTSKQHALVAVLALVAVIVLLHWLFGNLYEAVVISPNWVIGSTAQLERLHGFFVATSPTAYFVPSSLAAPLLVWAAHFCNRLPTATADFRRASSAVAVLTALNAFIVSTIVMVLFDVDFRSHSEAELHALCVRWNVLNGVRMGLTAATAYCAFQAYRKLERSAASAV